MRPVTHLPARCEPLAVVRGEFLDLSGARLYYYAAGTRGAGVPVVFLHGFPTSSHLWSDVVPLMPPGHRLVVLDLLGFGRSDRPLGRPVDVQAHATRVVELLDELTIERVCVVGHGIGGGIAQALALQFPRRVSHLCLVDCAGFERWPVAVAPLAHLALPFVRFLPPGLLATLLRGDLLRGYTSRDRAGHSIDLYLRPFDGPEGRDAIAAHIRDLSTAENASLAARLSSLSVPTAIVWGEHDPVIPVTIGRRLQRAIPGSTLDVIPDARHFTPEEAPRQVADAVQTLLAR